MTRGRGATDDRSGRSGLAARLFAAQVVTIVAGIVTLIIVAVLVGPPLLNAHLSQALGPLTDEVRHHLEQGYSRTAAITVVIAVMVSLAVAVVVSLMTTRRLTRPIGAMADAASRVAVGDYGTRVPDARLGAEMERLTTAFNVMAGQLEDTERSRQRLLGDLAHELRTPLATIQAYHEALADGVRAPDQQAWAVLATQTARIERLIEDIALVSRAEEHALPLHLVPAQVANVLTPLLSAVHAQYESKGVALDVNVPPGLPAILVDPDRLGQVMMNLLSNALRHTPTGGHVAVIGQVTQEHGSQLHFSRDSADKAVTILVRDDGEGISEEDLSLVFQRFYRADSGRDRVHGGSGIGLTIARALTQAQGGSLSATSDGLGSGSTFTLTLPAASVVADPA